MTALALGRPSIQLGTRYDFDCVGPIERLRETYCDLRDEILAALREQAPVAMLLALQRRLDAIPMERKWLARIPHNLVVTVGLNHSLDQHLTGSAYTAAWYVGLTDEAPLTFAPSDTMSSHPGWGEVHTEYSQSTRPQLVLASPAAGGSIDNSANKVVYSITGSVTVGGAFVNTESTKNGSAGTLYGGGPFAEGDRGVANGDTINGTIAATATSS